MNEIPAGKFEDFHSKFRGDSVSIFGICADCGGMCEYNKVGTLIPGEKKYMANQLGVSAKDFADKYLDVLIVDGEKLDVLKFTEPCPFLSKNFECSCRKFKPVMCEIYPIVFEAEGQEVRYFLDDACPLMKNLEFSGYFNNTGIPAFEELGIPLKWFKCVEKYDHLNFDYQKIQKMRKSGPEKCEEFVLEDVIEAGVRE